MQTKTSDPREGLTALDFEVVDHYSVTILRPQNDWAREWIGDHLYTAEGEEPIWWGDGVVVEPRYLDAIVEGITAEGGIVGLAR